jgi:hypothetical protein
MRRGGPIGLLISALALGLGVVATVMVYGAGQQQEELLIRIGIPGALLLALAIGALIVWGRSLRSGPPEPEPSPWQSFEKSSPLDKRFSRSEDEGPR